jgi:phosphatidylglycerophosphatase A
MPAVVPTWSFMRAHPLRWVALGFGSGLVPRAPGTAGTLLAWLSFVALQPHLSDGAWLILVLVSLVLGIWACTQCARDMGVADPSAIVWDEIVAFWIVLWVLAPAAWGWQALAFALFRYFDAAKPGPVGWADGLFKSHAGIGWRQGAGILLDDLVAAGCTLLSLALLSAAWRVL